jgi:hypothetical protein
MRARVAPHPGARVRVPRCDLHLAEAGPGFEHRVTRSLVCRVRLWVHTGTGVESPMLFSKAASDTSPQANRSTVTTASNRAKACSLSTSTPAVMPQHSCRRPTTRRTTCSRSRSATNRASACRKRDERAARSTSCKPSVITTDGNPGPVDIGSTKRLAGDHGRRHPSCRHPRTTSGMIVNHLRPAHGWSPQLTIPHRERRHQTPNTSPPPAASPRTRLAATTSIAPQPDSNRSY